MSSMLPMLKAMLSNTMYVKYGQHIKELVKDNKEFSLLYGYLDNLHNKYNRDISLEEYALYVMVNCLEKDKPVLGQILSDIRSTEADSDVFADVFADVMKRHKAYELAIAALEVSEGRKEFDDLVVLSGSLQEHKDKVEDVESLFVTNDLEVLFNESIQKQGLRWRLNALNKMMGSLRTGDFGFLFARPETGKTTFLASEVSYFATQVDKPILWFNNEEQGTKVQLRLYQGMLGLNLEQLFSDIHGNKRRYLELGGKHIRIFDSASIHRKQVEQLVRELSPSLVIFDQIDKIKGFADDREDLRLGSIYIWAREIAKQYCPVIGVSQADASGEGKKWLTMENVANAKTAKQAEADWILGIGRSHADSEMDMRHLHLSKNKLTGDEDTDPDLRHGKQTVKINTAIARYEDL